MNGQSFYHFKHGSVAITTDTNMAPNDADLTGVRIAMENRLGRGDWRYHFPVDNMMVDITVTSQGVDRETVYIEALKPLQATDYKPDHAPDGAARSGLLGAAQPGDIYEFREGSIALIWHGYWAYKNGEALNVSISHQGLTGQWVVNKWDGIIANIPDGVFDHLDQAEQCVRDKY